MQNANKGRVQPNGDKGKQSWNDCEIASHRYVHWKAMPNYCKIICKVAILKGTVVVKHEYRFKDYRDSGKHDHV